MLEDSDDDALLLRAALEDDFTPEITRVENAEELRGALARGPWDMVIADYQLPHFDGLTALRLVRTVEPDLPVILVSGAMGDEFIVRAIRAGAQDFIRKDTLVRLAPAVLRELGDAESRRMRRRAEQERAITAELLRLTNVSHTTRELAQAALTFFQAHSGCSAVGLRLRDGLDYPYYEARGFPAEFVELENSLCQVGEDGRPVCDAQGNALLDCMCGNVLCGRFDPSLPFFTARGSFWSNGTTALLASTSPAERQARTRNRCNGEGYESVALIALRMGEDCLGLLQLNDRRPGMFTAELIARWERLADTLAVALARFRAGEALQASEARFRGVFDNAAVGIVQAEPDGRILLANETCCRMLGYTADELVGMHVLDITYPDDRNANARLLQCAAAGEIDRYSLEKRYLRKDGSFLWASLSVSVVEQADGMRYAIAIIEDITERKANEESLQQAMRRFELLAHTAATLLQSANPQGEVEALCTRVLGQLDCHAFFNFLVDHEAGKLRLNACAGIPAEEARRIEWLDYGVAVCGCAARDGCRIVAEHIPDTPDPRTDLVKSYGIRAYACHPLLGPGGEVLGTLSFGTRSRDTYSPDDLALMSAVTDLVAMAIVRMRGETERACLLAEVERRAAELDAVLDSMADGLSIIDPHGRAVRMNIAAERMMGISVRDMEATIAERLTRFQVTFPDGTPVQPADSPMQRALQGEVVQGFIQVMHFAERLLWLSVSAAPIRTPDGQQLGAVTTFTDITALHALQEQERLLLQTVAHDLRAPVTIIAGHLELLMDALGPEAAARPGIGALQRALRRLNAMVDDLTEVTHLEGGIPLHCEPTALDAYLSDLLSRSEGVVDAAHVTLAAESGLVVQVDPARLERIVLNLLINAQKYSAPGSPIRVDVSRDGALAVCRITDLGQGIPAEDLPRIFDRFYRAARGRKAQGIGLGLYITRVLVEAHGGTIGVESTEGQGSTFTFTLPLVSVPVTS
jgi:PAS domain S-box-containing protein